MHTGSRMLAGHGGFPKATGPDPLCHTHIPTSCGCFESPARVETTDMPREMSEKTPLSVNAATVAVLWKLTVADEAIVPLQPRCSCLKSPIHLPESTREAHCYWLLAEIERPRTCLHLTLYGCFRRLITTSTVQWYCSYCRTFKRQKAAKAFEPIIATITRCYDYQTTLEEDPQKGGKSWPSLNRACELGPRLPRDRY